MTKRILLAATTFLILAACGQAGGDRMESQASKAAPPPAPMMAERDMAFDEDGMANGGAGESDPAAQQYIAYTHSIGMRLPIKSIEPVMNGHVAACNAAGPSKCIITNSWYNTYSEDEAQAFLQIRAVPEWIDTFLNGIDTDAEEANGEVTNRQKNSEDLTVTIIDTGARLKAQQTLQKRLEDLLENRDGELGDILATERELARVNGQIDSLQSSMKALMLRVEMSQLSVNYETKRNPVSRSALSPVAKAFGDFFYNLASALGAVITAFAFGLPILLLIGALLWVWLKLIWPRIRRRKTT